MASLSVVGAPAGEVFIPVGLSSKVTFTIQYIFLTSASSIVISFGGAGSASAASVTPLGDAVDVRFASTTIVVHSPAAVAPGTVTITTTITRADSSLITVSSPPGVLEFRDTSKPSVVAFAPSEVTCPLHTTLEVTQGQILSQSPTDATRFWWHLYGS